MLVGDWYNAGGQLEMWAHNRNASAWLSTTPPP